MSKSLIIGSRASFLARIQTFIVKQELKKKIKNIKVTTQYASTKGDENQGEAPWKDLGYGIFTGSLTNKLVNRSYDCVVHSFKDLPVLKSRTDYFTIKRDDPRDVLLIKKTSLNKKNLILGTSSPRRKSSAKDLKDFIGVKNFKTKMIRGNVPTRLLKVLSNHEYDAVFIAKAAIDRIYKYGNKVDKKETKKFFNLFKKFKPFILPLSVFPTAASQGAIAIEYLKKDKKTKSILKRINCDKTLNICNQERDFLKKYGGGCGLDIGITIENIKKNNFLFSKGIDAKNNKPFHKNKILTKQIIRKTKSIFPQNIKDYQMFDRIKLKLPQIKNSTVILTRPDFSIKDLNSSNFFITSGTQTWKKLSSQKKIAQCTFDGLGEDYRLPEIYYRNYKNIKKISYKNSISIYKTKQIDGYELIPQINSKTIKNLFDAKIFYWMSYSAFKLAKAIRPEITRYEHCSGPGSTFEQLKKEIPIKRLNLFFNYKDFKESVYQGR